MKKLYYFILLFFLISCQKGTSNFSNNDRYFARAKPLTSINTFIASSNSTMEAAQYDARELCEKESGSPCRIVNTWKSQKVIEEERIKIEQENQKIRVEQKKKEVKENLERFISQCEYIGFKRNTEKMGECVLKISQTEKQIVNTQSNNSSGDTLANLIILQESLKLLNPPASPRRNVQCTYNTVGSILGVNCF